MLQVFSEISIIRQKFDGFSYAILETRGILDAQKLYRKGRPISLAETCKSCSEYGKGLKFGTHDLFSAKRSVSQTMKTGTIFFRWKVKILRVKWAF